MPFLPRVRSTSVPDELYWAKPNVGATRAEQRIIDEITDGTFRPPDAKDKASIEEAYALFVPFWRIDMERSDQALRLGRIRIGNVPLPTQESTEAQAVWMICARTAFPYEMKHPKTVFPGDAKPLKVSLAELEHGDPILTGGWEVIDHDVSRGEAEQIASKALARMSAGAHGLFTESQVTARAVHFVRYPIWFARYRYRGVASSDGTDLFYVGISALDGTPLTAEHPSKLRSGAARVKRFFFDD